MNKSNISYRLAAQTLLLTVVVCALYILIYGMSVNMVMKIYYLGGLSFVKGFNPYELTLNNGFSNQFKYSPFFALITGELSQIPAHWQRLVFGMWQLVGAAVFSLGLSSWSRLSLRQPIVIYVS